MADDVEALVVEEPLPEVPVDPPKRAPWRKAAREAPQTVILHEDGFEITVSPDDYGSGKERRVRALNGTYYDHVGEDENGRWTYREER